jgi:cytochrome c-type biogenesis protein CcmF
VISTVVMEFARGIQARKETEPPSPAALLHLVQKNKRRYGGYIVHLGVVLIFIGVLGSSVFQKEAHAPLMKGQDLTIGPYTLTLLGIQEKQVANAMHTRAELHVQREGKRLDTMYPAKAMYFKGQQPMTEVALLQTPAEDLYVILGGVNEDGSASIQSYINPLVSLVWLGGVIMVLGTIVCLGDRMRLKREEKLLT